MRLILAEPRLLKESVSIISELVNEAKIKVTKNGIELLAMDPASVSLTQFTLLSSAFVEYELENEMELGLNLLNLTSVLKRAKPSDMVIISYNKLKNRLDLQLKGESTRTFHLPIIDINDAENKVPSLAFSATVEMPTVLFDEAIEDMNVVADSLAFIAEETRFTIEAQGKINAGRVEISGDSEISIKIGKEQKVMSKYSIEYLRKMIKGSKLTDTVVLSFNKEYPLCLEYKVTDKLLLKFILAPRTDND